MIAAMFFMATSASAELRYKGYVETNGGVFIPADYYGTGVMAGISTSHGVELIQGLFVGAGIDANYVTYTEPGQGRHSVDESDYSGNFAVFAEGRYNFLRKKRISPFVGLRLGGGYEGVEEDGCFYGSLAAGCTFNITKRFGLDVSLGYSIWSGSDSYKDEYDSYHETTWSRSFSGLALRVGVHF